MKRLALTLVLLLFAATLAVAGDYIIGDGDTLQVAVWGVPELSVPVSVRPDGKITLPAAGDVVASGYSPSQLGQELTRVLGKYVKTPIVTVTVNNVTNNRIYISGGGVPSHVINLSGRTTLFKLLCSLEGIHNADLVNASLMRAGEKVQVDFDALFNKGDLTGDTKLEPEDILYLPTNELNKVYVVGAVTNPQYLLYREGLKILDAILECGGFTKFAKESDVLILRKKGDSRERLKINIKELMNDGDLAQNIALQRGDYVIVREGMF
jgi:polysaccharide export outer membrane protein